MEKAANDVNGCKNRHVSSVGSEKGEDHVNREDKSESISLLPPRKGGISKKQEKPRRKVQWNDNNGHKLTEVMEYEPSDVSDSEDEDSDACMCTMIGPFGIGSTSRNAASTV